MSSPGRRAEDPQPGDVVLFRWRGTRVHGEVAGYGDALRLPIHRLVNGKRGRLTHHRNRTQLFEPPGGFGFLGGP
jgi:hypothetical protein